MIIIRITSEPIDEMNNRWKEGGNMSRLVMDIGFVTDHQAE